MKFGFDVHGVLDASFCFALITRLLVTAGHEVHVITGEEETEKLKLYLNRLDVAYTHLFSITTHCKEAGVLVRYDSDNHPWVSSDEWDKAKADYCALHKIDIHFDDSEEYGKYFTTPYMFIRKEK